MIAKKYRLPVQLFPRQTKTVFREKELTVKATHNGLPYNRFGVIIARGDVKLSSRRNALKRAALNFLKTKKGLFERQSDGRDFLIILNPSSGGNLTKDKIISGLSSHGLSF